MSIDALHALAELAELLAIGFAGAAAPTDKPGLTGADVAVAVGMGAGAVV